MQLVARQRLQKFGILVGAGLEDGAVEILVDQEMAQAAGGQDADAGVAGKCLHRLAHGLAELDSSAAAAAGSAGNRC